MIHAYYVWSDNVAKLHDQFKAFHKNFSQIQFYPYKLINKWEHTEFGNKEWFHSLWQKTERISHILGQTPNRYSLFIDIDVFIYNEKKLVDFLQKTAQDSTFIAMQEDNRNEINSGFLWIKSTPKNRKLFRDSSRILKWYNKLPSPMHKIYLWMNIRLTKLVLADQTLINDLIIRREIRPSLIGDKNCCWGKNEAKKHHLFHHAVCAKDQEEKISLLQNQYKKFQRLTAKSVLKEC